MGCCGWEKLLLSATMLILLTREKFICMYMFCLISTLKSFLIERFCGLVLFGKNYVKTQSELSCKDAVLVASMVLIQRILYLL